MSDSKLGVTRENLLLLLPPALTHDPAMMARAEADAGARAARLAEIDRVRIISQTSTLWMKPYWIFWPGTSRWTGGTPITPWRKSGGR